jgi:hypothetical protein
MTLQQTIQETIDSINVLSKYVKTHQSATVSFSDLDELQTAEAELQELVYELESRVQDDEDDLEGYEVV